MRTEIGKSSADEFLERDASMAVKWPLEADAPPEISSASSSHTLQDRGGGGGSEAVQHDNESTSWASFTEKIDDNDDDSDNDTKASTISVSSELDSLFKRIQSKEFAESKLSEANETLYLELFGQLIAATHNLNRVKKWCIPQCLWFMSNFIDAVQGRNQHDCWADLAELFDMNDNELFYNFMYH